MTTTTIRLAPDLKKRVTRLAKSTGQSAHNLLLELIDAGVTRAEARADFVAEAHSRLAEFEKTGRGVPWSEMKTWLEARARGEKPALPRVRRLVSSKSPATR